MIIRSAKAEDAERILQIYAYYIENTSITYEYTVPTVEEFRERIAHIQECYPYLVAEEEGELIGYVYASRFHPRAAYDRCAEGSIYLARDCRGRGVGKALYAALEQALIRQNILNLYACIATPDEDDEYLTGNSRDFHAHMGYRLIGEFFKCGYKFGRWYNMVWMEKMLGQHTDDPAPLIPYADSGSKWT